MYQFHFLKLKNYFLLSLDVESIGVDRESRFPNALFLYVGFLKIVKYSSHGTDYSVSKVQLYGITYIPVV